MEPRPFFVITLLACTEGDVRSLLPQLPFPCPCHLASCSTPGASSTLCNGCRCRQTAPLCRQLALSCTSVQHFSRYHLALNDSLCNLRLFSLRIRNNLLFRYGVLCGPFFSCSTVLVVRLVLELLSLAPQIKYCVCRLYQLSLSLASLPIQESIQSVGSSLLYDSVARGPAKDIVIGGWSTYVSCLTSIFFDALRIRPLWSPP